MYTQCPMCDRHYRISAAELKAALGKVRCAHCQNVFNALSQLTDTPLEILTLTESVSAPAAEIAAESPAIHTLEMPIYFGPERIEPAADDELIPETIGMMPMENVTDTLTADTQPAPPSRIIIPDLIGAPARLMADEFVYPRKKPYGGLGTTLWSSGIVLLVALLALQYLYAMRNDLARNPELRPVLEQLCGAVKIFVHCEIPLRRDLTKIELQGRSIEAHPRIQNTLLVSVTLLNKATFRQAYPALELNLADFNGALIARRRFQPADYLTAGADLAQGLTPQGVAQVALEIVTPAAPLNLDLTSWDFVLF